MKIAVVMDPISDIDFKKDSTLLLIYEAQKRNHDVIYIESKNLFFDGKDACALSSKIAVKMDPKSWFSLDVANKIFFAVPILPSNISLTAKYDSFFSLQI